MDHENGLITIEVAYALPERQTVIVLQVIEGTTVAEAIRLSGILQKHPEIDLDRQSVGIFGKVCPADRKLETGDRVEIYRPLRADPREARRTRVSARRSKPTSIGRDR